MNKNAIFVFWAGLCLSALGDTLTPLSGTLPSRLEQSRAPFVVNADIVVPAGETVVMEKGVVIHFRNFTGLIIRGTLIAEGKKTEPIVFTSEHDRGKDEKTSPAPYDWNGITVEEGGTGTLFRHCHIRYSLFGINSVTEFIVVDNCLFKQNGRADITVRGTKYMAGEEPFSYLTYKKDGKTLIKYGTDVSDGQVLRNIGRYGGAVLFVAGVLVGTVEAKKLMNSERELKELSDVDEHIDDPEIIRKWDDAKKRRGRHLSSMILSYTFAGIGAAGFVLSFTIEY
ncbi:MAG: hypothetical protein ACLFQB_04790 [Chitinispirillaceae bacterium]